MKSPQLLMQLLTGAIGLALGLTLAPKFHSEDANIPAAPAGNFTNQSTAQIGRSGTEAETKISIRTRARERKEEPKSSEPHVSMPLKNVVQMLKETDFGNLSDLDSLEKGLGLLGATEMEQEQILKLVEASKSEVLAAEKTHTKLAKVSDDLIKIDTSGVSGPAQEIANRTKDGIRASLSADLAEVLISAINWEQTFPTAGEPITLNINRGTDGTLVAMQMQGSGGSGSGLGAEFVDDGRPIPAEKIFGDRWKPFLNGVTILPKGP